MSDGQSGRIPESFIESVLSKTDIVSLIQESVKLKKSGNNYSACCPFHQEKTPSFTVSAQKQFYHCFGCGEHGDAIAFLRANQGFTFIEALEQLCTRLGLEIPRDEQAAAKEKVKTVQADALSQVAAFYQAQLKSHAQGAQAIQYLKQRGLTGHSAKRFGIGFAPSGWTNLVDHFKGSPTFSALEETGLIKKHSSGRYYDLFRSRITFPIRDRRGKVIAFGGRALGQDNPKYLNTPESPLFHKSYCVYGIYEALQAREKWQSAIVVEGYLDVIALAQHGVEGAFATLGTAITAHHITQLFQMTDEIVFCLDGDKAGREAAWKSLQMVLPLLQQGRQVRFAHLPQGEDPDSYVTSQGLGAFQSLVQESMPLSDYLFNTLFSEQNISSLDNRAKIAEKARALLAPLPDGVFKEMMFDELARLLASTPQVVRGERARRYGYSRYRDFSAKAVVSPPPKLNSPAFMAAAILLRKPALLAEQDESAQRITEVAYPGCDILRRILSTLGELSGENTTQLREKLAPLSKFQETALNACIDKVACIPEEGLAAELSGAMHRLAVVGQEQIAQQLIQKAKTSDLSTDEKRQLKEILQKKETK